MKARRTHKCTFAFDNDVISCSPFVWPRLTIPFGNEVSEAVSGEVAAVPLPVIET